jgi:hypothetical protein
MFVGGRTKDGAGSHHVTRCNIPELLEFSESTPLVSFAGAVGFITLLASYVFSFSAFSFFFE